MLFNPPGRQHDITQPTLVVQGTTDQVVDPGNAGVLADLSPNAPVKLFDEAGHLLYWEQHTRFARVVAGFRIHSAMPACESTSTIPRAS
jgi:pimeloyl-ACP methyl ester carboxylesterase